MGKKIVVKVKKTQHNPEKKHTVAEFNKNIKMAKVGMPMTTCEDSSEFDQNKFRKILKTIDPVMMEAIAMKYLADNKLKVVKG